MLITGGTSGIGLAAAQRFAAAGDCVLIAGRDAARGAAASSAIVIATPDALGYVIILAGGAARFQ